MRRLPVRELPLGGPALTVRWRSESDEAAPATVGTIDDAVSADEALRRTSRGEHLRYDGDFHNARQLLQAMGRRLEARRRRTRGALEAFREERRLKQLRHETVGRVVVALDREYRLSLRRAPDVAEACREAWGAADGDTTLVALSTLLGLLGAAEWRRKGLEVPGLRGRLVPHYGVYAPTRSDYVELLAGADDVAGRRVIDVGTGTGVLSFVLLQQGAASAIGTDVEPRAVACATENARRLGLSDRFTALQADLFPPERAELVVFNPPWIPEAPRSHVDRAVFDEGGHTLARFLEGLPDHLAPGGRGLLLLSDLAELLGLREAGWLAAAASSAGLELRALRSTPARHGRAKDPTDPLHAARSRETTTLYGLRRP